MKSGVAVEVVSKVDWNVNHSLYSNFFLSIFQDKNLIWQI